MCITPYTFAWMHAGLANNGSPQQIPDIHIRYAVIVHLKAGANQSNISSNIMLLPCWIKCWNGLRNYKIYEVSKKKQKA